MRSRPARRPPPTARRCRTTRPKPTRCTKTRGKKGVPHTDPDDPARRRANQAKGHGTWETDRPPVPGMVGRRSGRVWFRVGHRCGSAELVDATVLPATVPGAMVYTDDWNGYNPLGRRGRGHATVNHNRGEFARDDDGDGVREVHCNTMEGGVTSECCMVKSAQVLCPRGIPFRRRENGRSRSRSFAAHSPVYIIRRSHPWRGSGRGFGTSSGRSGVSTKRTENSTSSFSSGLTTSRRSPTSSWGYCSDAREPPNWLHEPRQLSALDKVE